MSQKRKRHTEEFKAKVALEAIKGVRTTSELNSAFGIHPTVISTWKRQLVEGAAMVFRRGGVSGVRADAELTQPLYEQIGRLSMEVDWLKKKL